MKTKFTHYRNTLQRSKLIETLVYASIAISSIGQMFFATRPVGYIEAALAMLGIIFSSLVIFSITPITTLLYQSRSTRDNNVVDFHTEFHQDAFRTPTHNGQKAA